MPTIDPLNKYGCMWVSDAVAKGTPLHVAEQYRCKPNEGGCLPCIEKHKNANKER